MNTPLGCLWNIIVGTMLLGAGILVALSAATVNTFECRRLEPPTNQGKCELSAQRILGSESISLPIESLQGAEVEESINSEETITYRVVILTTEGNFPLTQHYTGGQSEESQNIVREIRSFIQTETQESLYIEQDDPLVLYLVGGMLGVVGVIVILRAPHAPVN